MRRVVFVHQREHRRRRRPLGIQHGGGADRHRKGQRVAEAIGEKQFCRRQADVVLANAEHLLGIGLRRRREIGMQMPHALGHAGRARRIQPERRLVGMGRRGRERIALAREFVGEFLVAVRVLAGDDDVLEIRHPPDHVLHHRQQRFGNEQHPRAAIRQHIGILVRGQQRIERHRHDAGADRAEKHGRKIDRVEHDHRHALFAADAEPAQHVGDAAALLLQVAIGELGDGVGEGELCRRGPHRHCGRAARSPRCRNRDRAAQRTLSPQILRIIIHRKPPAALAVNPRRHYVSEAVRVRSQKSNEGNDRAPRSRNRLSRAARPARPHHARAARHVAQGAGKSLRHFRTLYRAARKRQGQRLDRAAAPGVERDGRASRRSHSRRPNPRRTGP